MLVRKIIVAVTNDLTHDQRVSKVCRSLQDLGFTPYLVGRQLPTSAPLNRDYPTKRFKLLFNSGALFYAEYNLRLFLFLLFRKYDSIHANDLDTLLASYLAGVVRRKRLVYDSHEYFTEVPELQENKFAKNTWEKIERWIFPSLKDVITVNQSIANLYSEKYGTDVKVMRNIPTSRIGLHSPSTKKLQQRKDLQLPTNMKILIVQGTGINIDRGNEELVEAMRYLDGYLLLIIGSGDVLSHLKNRTDELMLHDKILFKDKMPYQQLMKYTAASDAGISIDKDTNINYRYSLPNKLFDFIHAGIPCVVSNLPEVKRVVERYNVGTVLTSHEPTQMAEEIKNFFSRRLDGKFEASLNERLFEAAKSLTWEKESSILKEIYSSR